MSTPALIFRVPSADRYRVGGLSLLDRLLVTLHRGGCAPITIIGAGRLPKLPRARALAVEFATAIQEPESPNPTLVLASNLLITPDDVRRLVADRGRLMGDDGALLPIGIAGRPTGTLKERLAGVPVIAARGPARQIDSRRAARQAESALWATLGSAADGLVDRHFNRPIGRPLSKLLTRTPATPNQVTAAAMLLGLVAAGLFARGGRREAIGGAALFQFSALVDCIDGELARMHFKESPFGKWFDLVADQIVHIALFTGIAVGVSRSGGKAPVRLLAVSAAIGVLLSFSVVTRGLLQGPGAEENRFQRLIDALTNRDFSVALLLCAAAGTLEAFLWAAAIGVHGFWIAALIAQSLDRRAGRPGASGVSETEAA